MIKWFGSIFGNTIASNIRFPTSGVFASKDVYYSKQEGGWQPGTQLSVPISISAPGIWDLAAQGDLVLSTAGQYTIGSPSGTQVLVLVWGAGGGCAVPSLVASQPGGGGGFVQGTFTIDAGSSCTFVVGNAVGPAGPGAFGNPVVPAANLVPTTGASGGYSGVFLGTVSHSNAILVAGGGGSPGANDGGSMGAGGGGGGTTGEPGGSPYVGPANGAGGTQSAGGAGGTSPHTPGGSGSALQGGVGGNRGGSGAHGGSGGSGYYGGGGGAGQVNINSDGGGGGGGGSYLGPSVSNGTTIGTTTNAAANSSSPKYVPGKAQGSVFPGGSVTGSPGLIVITL